MTFGEPFCVTYTSPNGCGPRQCSPGVRRRLARAFEKHMAGERCHASNPGTWLSLSKQVYLAAPSAGGRLSEMTRTAILIRLCERQCAGCGVSRPQGRRLFDCLATRSGQSRRSAVSRCSTSPPILVPVEMAETEASPPFFCPDRTRIRDHGKHYVDRLALPRDPWARGTVAHARSDGRRMLKRHAYPPALDGFTTYAVGDIRGRADLLDQIHGLIDGDKPFLSPVRNVAVYRSVRRCADHNCYR